MNTFTDTNNNFFIRSFNYGARAYEVKCSCGRHSSIPTGEHVVAHRYTPTSCPMCGTRLLGSQGRANFSRMDFEVTEIGDKQFKLVVHIRNYNPHKNKYVQNTKYEVGFNYLDKKYDIKVNGKDPRTVNIANYYKRVFAKVPLRSVSDILDKSTDSAFWRTIFGVFNFNRTSFGEALYKLISEDYSGIEIISTSRLSPILKQTDYNTIYRSYQSTDSILRSKGKNLREVLNMTKGEINSMLRTVQYILEAEGVPARAKENGLKLIETYKVFKKDLPTQQVEELVKMAVEEGHFEYINSNSHALATFMVNHRYTVDPIRFIRYLLRDLKLEQGILNPDEGMRLLRDYLRMSKDLEREAERYPSSLKKVHDISAMNYRVVSDTFKERNFKRRSEELQHWQHRGRRFSFILPDTPKDLVREGTSLHHCVASYVDDVIRQNCAIVFMRSNQELEKSHVTIEVRNRRVVQARGQSNRACNQEEKDAIRAWANAKDIEYTR